MPHFFMTCDCGTAEAVSLRDGVCEGCGKPYHIEGEPQYYPDEKTDDDPKRGTADRVLSSSKQRK